VRNPLGGGIAMRIWLTRHFAELIDNMLGRRQIRIAHTEINNIFPARARRRPHRIDFSNNVRGQAFDAVEVFSHDLLAVRGMETESCGIFCGKARGRAGRCAFPDHRV
jgi:hypothetical protein